MFQLNLTPFYHGEGCGCGCGHDHHEDEHEHFHEHGETCDCGCGHDHSIEDEVYVMVDQETGEEFRFVIVDDFEYKDAVYCVVLSADHYDKVFNSEDEGEDEPQACFMKLQQDEEGDIFLTLSDEEYDEVAEHYQKILQEYVDELE